MLIEDRTLLQDKLASCVARCSAKQCLELMGLHIGKVVELPIHQVQGKATISSLLGHHGSNRCCWHIPRGNLDPIETIGNIYLRQ